MKFVIFTLSILLIMSCNATENSFTEEQVKTIGSDPLSGPMRVFKIDHPADSLLLRRSSEPLTLEDARSVTCHVLKQRMLSTVTSIEERGVGIAAPQVGILKRLVAVQRVDKEGAPFEFYINPRITARSGEPRIGPEGCLSVPGVSGLVARASEITLEYLDDRSGEIVEETVEGFAAVIFQHEIDHLDGVLFIDKTVDPESLPADEEAPEEE